MVLCLRCQKVRLVFNEFCAYLPPFVYYNDAQLFFLTTGQSGKGVNALLF